MILLLVRKNHYQVNSRGLAFKYKTYKIKHFNHRNRLIVDLESFLDIW